MARLYCAPLGQSARPLFYKELAGSAYGSGVLVLPNSIVQRKAREEASIVCCGIDALANKILNSNGYVGFDMINRRSQELVMQQLIEYLAAKDKLSYFAKLSEKKGFVKAVTSLMGQLSRSGATEDEIVAAIKRLHEEPETGGRRRNYAKDEEIATLYGLYRAYLRNENWYDLEGKYRLAKLVLESDKPRVPWQQVYFSDFYSFDPLQLEFIRALDKHCDVQIGLMYDENRPQIFAAAQATYMYLAGFCQLEKIDGDIKCADYASALQHLSANFEGKCEPVPAAGSVRTLEFASRENEMRWVLTMIKRQLQEGIKASDILLAVRDFTNYSGLRQLADEYGVPVNLPRQTNLAVQPLTEFVLLMLAASGDNRDGVLAYFKLLSSALGKQLFTLDTEWAESLKQDIYFTSRSQARQKCAELLASADKNDTVLELTDEFIGNLPSKARLCDYLELLQEFIRQLQLEELWGERYKAGELSLLALKNNLLSKSALLETMELLGKDYENCGQKEKRFSAAELAEILGEAMRDVQLTLANGRSDGVLITEVFNVQGLAYKYVYLLGVREGEFPAGCSENWIYNDAERGQLTTMGIDMATTAQAFAEDAYFFAAAASQARQQLVVTWHRDDNAGASPYIDKLRKLYSDVNVETPITEAKPYASPREVMQLGSTCDAAWLQNTVGSEALAAAAADDARRELNSYNGVLSDGSLQKAVAKSLGSSFSPSALEIYAGCPFRFLGERLWQQQKFEEKSDTAEPADEGNVLHAVLARFMSRHLREKLTKYALQDLLAELAADFDAVCADFKDKGAVADDVLWQAESKRLQNVLRRWLHYEYAQQDKWDFTPCAVEWDFSSRNGKPLKLTLPDGDVVSLLGRIDRIDRNGDKLFITDYKRSKAPSKSDLTNGLDMQLPVYLLAAQAMYGKDNDSIAGGGYLSLKEAKRKSSVVFEDVGAADVDVNKNAAQLGTDWQQFKEYSEKLLAGYIEGMRMGQFAVQPKGSCAFCALQGICRVGLSEGGEDDA